MTFADLVAGDAVFVNAHSISGSKHELPSLRFEMEPCCACCSPA
jgi:hypothetical protein